MRTLRLTLMLAITFLCGAMCVTAWAGIYSRELTTPGDFGFGIFERVQVSEAAGGLVLSKSMNCLPYLWVPSPSECVVSKIEARSGKEMARYRMGPESSGWSPCSVATDYAGNAYVACTDGHSGHIVKIQAFGSSRSLNTGPSSTSFDFTGDGKADALGWGKDSRVSVVAELSAEPSSLAFDERGVLWASLWSEQSIVAVDASTGEIGKTVYLTGKPDTMIVGSRDSLWVLCADAAKIALVDPLLGCVRDTFDITGIRAQSICPGDENTLWLGTTTGLVRFDIPSASIAQRSRTEIVLEGIATDRGGSVWAACPHLNQLTRFSESELEITAQVPVGRTPVSVSADADGYIWALNKDSANASRVDPRSVSCPTTALTARSPLSTTPFASCLIKPGLSPSGSWTGLFDSGIRGAGWGTITWDATLASSKVTVEARSADRPTAITDQQFQQVSNGEEMLLPSGRYLEVKVSLAGGMNTTPVLRGLRIAGRNLPPDVSNAGPTQTIIRRLDGKLESIGICGVVDPEGHEVTIAITGVTQDEPVAGLWKDDKAPDAIVAKDEVQLRAECNPGTQDSPSNGRVYTISFCATDALGASSKGKVKVMVPASLKWDAVAIEDKNKYDSTKDPAKASP